MYTKIIQITDCHLFGDRNAQLKHCNTYHSLRRVCAQIRRQHNDTTLLLLTGDLSQDKSVESYHLLQTLISELGIPAAAIPGNHDNPQIMQTVFDPSIITTANELAIGGWRLMLLNSSVPQQVSGKIEKYELERLAHRLSNETDMPVMIALHHPPVALGSTWLDKVGLENADELNTILYNSKQTRVAIFGHAHQVYYTKIRQIAYFCTPSTCRQFLPASAEFALDILPPAYRVLKLYPDGDFQTHIEFLQPD